MMIAPNLPRRKRFRLLLRVLFLALGSIAAFIASILLEEKAYAYAVVPASFVLVAAFLEFVLADVLAERLYPARTARLLETLEANLRGIHDELLGSIARAIESLSECDKNMVSGTFHLLVELFSPTGEGSVPALVQVTDYRGRFGGRRWRFTEVSKGLIGRCSRTGEPDHVNFSDIADYDNRMVFEFGYTKDEISEHTREARSYLAQPVFSGDDLVGVLYMFSTEKNVFPKAAKITRLETAANEIAAFLRGAQIV